jgi:Omp85 superfamily domain
MSGRAASLAAAALPAMLLMASSVAAARADGLPAYHVQAAVQLRAPQIEGSVDVSFTNRSDQVLTDAVIFLFPNRFAEADEGINDFNRPFVYPEQEFEPGAMALVDARDAGVATSIEPVHAADVPDGCVVRLAIAPLAPGARRTLTLHFRTVVPYRFGPFGRFEDQLSLAGGWYPYLAALGQDGTWQVNAAPPVSDFDVDLALEQRSDVVLNGQSFEQVREVKAKVDAVHYLSLVTAPQLQRDEVDAGATHVVYFHRPAQRTSRISFEPPPVETLLDTVRASLEGRPLQLRAPAQLVIVEAPLRLHLTAPGEGMVLVSDRALKVHWLLRPYHEMQLAQAVYAALLRPQLAPHEPNDDYPWLGEGVSRVLAARFIAETHPDTRSVQDWIERFNIFAIVDRFETAPKIPFVGTFFERAPVADELHAQITTFNNDLPPGHVILGKLRQLLGDAMFERVVAGCVAARQEFRECAARKSGRNLDPFFAQWLQAYPQINYALADVHLNQAIDDSFVSQLTVRRETTRAVQEPVDVQLRSVGGQTVNLQWDGSGDRGRLTVVTPRRVCQVVIDPDRKLIETTRADNFRPPEPQIVLDTAEVEITSTEFGFSGLLVGRERYDYRKDLAVAGFYTNRSVGADAGARYHWGPQNDPTLYRHNVYGFYGVQALDRSFNDKQHPDVRTTGHANNLGVRYNYNNIFAYDNPTEEVDLRLFTDWYDQAVGSNYNYLDWGASLVLTHPLLTHRTIVAGEITNAFSEPLGSSRVPLQGLYSLGGSRSIRGIGAEEQLGRNIFLLRGELRQAIYPEVDLNFLDLLVLRRAQARLFVDTGQVDNAAGRVYDPARYAVGVGVGLAAVYEFLGFFPSTAYIEIATRADRDESDVQFLFGTRQSF